MDGPSATGSSSSSVLSYLSPRRITRFFWSILDFFFEFFSTLFQSPDPQQLKKGKRSGFGRGGSADWRDGGGGGGGGLKRPIGRVQSNNTQACDIPGG